MSEHWDEAEGAALESDGGQSGPGLSDLLQPGDERALSRYLAGRERAPAEVRQYLNKRGILRSWHDRILEKLQAMDLINEVRFCRGRIEHRLRNGQGPRRVEQELQSVGIDRNVARECLAEIEEDSWEAICLELAEEKLKAWMQREDAYWKIMQFLAYRGFESSMAERAMKLLKQSYPTRAKRIGQPPRD